MQPRQKYSHRHTHWMHALAIMLCGTLNIGLGGAATAQTLEIPAKQLRIVVPFTPGGPNDVIARVIAQKLGERWGQPVLVENRPGAGGNIGTAFVAKAPPDGSTVLLHSTAYVVNASLYASPGYDPFRDFVPVTLAAMSELIFVAHPSLGARDMREVAVLSKSAPVHAASPGTGTTGHLGIEMFRKMADADLTVVNYKGAAPALQEVVGGQVKLALTAIPPAVALIKSGRLVPLGVTGQKRAAALPDVPAVSESGYPDYLVDNMYIIVAPAGTPPATARLLRDHIAQVLSLADVRQRLVAQGFEPVADTPQALEARLREEHTKWARVIKESGARAE